MFTKKDRSHEYWAKKTEKLSNLSPGDIVVLRPYLNNIPVDAETYKLTFDREQRGMLCFKGPQLTRTQKWSEKREVMEIIKAQPTG